MPEPRYQKPSEWKGLYLAALFDTDGGKLDLRIMEAVRASGRTRARTIQRQ